MMLASCLVLLLVAVLVGLILCVGYDIVEHDRRIEGLESALARHFKALDAERDEAREEALR